MHQAKKDGGGSLALDGPYRRLGRQQPHLERSVTPLPELQIGFINTPFCSYGCVEENATSFMAFGDLKPSLGAFQDGNSNCQRGLQQCQLAKPISPSPELQIGLCRNPSWSTFQEISNGGGFRSIGYPQCLGWLFEDVALQAKRVMSPWLVQAWLAPSPPFGHHSSIDPTPNHSSRSLSSLIPAKKDMWLKFRHVLA